MGFSQSTEQMKSSSCVNAYLNERSEYKQTLRRRPMAPGNNIQRKEKEERKKERKSRRRKTRRETDENKESFK
jgi:hypothetical protein